MKDSFTRNGTVFSPISHGYTCNGQAEPLKARVTSNASTEKETATSIFPRTAGATSSPVQRGYYRGLKMLESQFEYLTPSFPVKKAPVDSAL